MTDNADHDFGNDKYGDRCSRCGRDFHDDCAIPRPCKGADRVT